MQLSSVGHTVIFEQTDKLDTLSDVSDRKIIGQNDTHGHDLKKNKKETRIIMTIRNATKEYDLPEQILLLYRQWLHIMLENVKHKFYLYETK